MLTLGIDSSTQGTKAVVYDTVAGRVVASAAVNYGKDLPEFGSPDGFLPNADPRVRRANPAMWVKGLELVLARLRDAGAPMGEIAAVGGDAQQHATVYLAADGSFSRAESPIWMDSSTGAEVAALDAQFGEALRARTGSPAIERFAAAQVMKFAKEEPDAWARTARVHLLSSYLTSVLTGEDAPIETGDGESCRPSINRETRRSSSRSGLRNTVSSPASPWRRSRATTPPRSWGAARRSRAAR